MMNMGVACSSVTIDERHDIINDEFHICGMWWVAQLVWIGTLTHSMTAQGVGRFRQFVVLHTHDHQTGCTEPPRVASRGSLVNLVER